MISSRLGAGGPCVDVKLQLQREKMSPETTATHTIIPAALRKLHRVTTLSDASTPTSADAAGSHTAAAINSS